jgi:hypothetical protein
MLKWLSSFWRRITGRARRQPTQNSQLAEKVYYPSNLHGRHR